MAVLHECERGFFCPNCGEQCTSSPPPSPQQRNESSDENVHPAHDLAGGDTYDKKEQKHSWNDHVSKSLTYGGIAVATVCALPIVAGFGTAGIAGGSIAALVQSSIGNVAAGSTFAVLQSLGATGVFATGATAGGTAAGSGFIANWWSKKNKKASDEEESSQGDSKNAEDEHEGAVAPTSKEIHCPFCGCVFLELKENRISELAGDTLKSLRTSSLQQGQ